MWPLEPLPDGAKKYKHKMWWCIVCYLFIENEIFCDLFVITDISSIDIPELDKSLIITNKLLVVEEGNSFAAFSSELTASLMENKINNFELFRISNNNIIPSSRNLELEVLPSKDKILSLIINNL